MNDPDKIYYFTFPKKHRLYGYYVEITGARNELIARENFYKKYNEMSWPRNRDDSKKKVVLIHYPKGCYDKIHLPSPEYIRISSNDPFLIDEKKYIKLGGWEKK